MGIPACFAQNIISAHALIPRHQILKAARDQMADMRHSVGSRRAIKKAKRRLVRLRRHGFFGNVVLLPKSSTCNSRAQKSIPVSTFLYMCLAFPFLCETAIFIFVDKKTLSIHQRDGKRCAFRGTTRIACPLADTTGNATLVLRLTRGARPALYFEPGPPG